LGSVLLKRTSTRLEEIKVVSEKGMFESQAGKMVYNVEGNVNAVGESAGELLQNIPSVSIDMDEKVTVRGSKATVLIDGVESGLSEMLDQIPADAIESIEVMKNPSVRYESKSGGSIINIKLRKQGLTGYNAKLEAGAGTLDKRNFNAVLGSNLRNWRLSVFANYKHSRKDVLQNSVRTIIADDNDNSLIQQQNDISYSTSLFSSASVAYFFKDKSFIDLKYIHQIREQDKDVDTHSKSYKSDILKSVSDISRIGVNQNSFHQFMFRFRNNLKKDGNKVEGSVLYSFNSPGNEYDQTIQPFSVEDGLPQNRYKTDDKIYDNSVKLLKAKLDYTLQIFPKTILETGGLFSINSFTQNLLNTKTNYVWDDSTNEYIGSENVRNIDFTNRNYSASVYALLSTRYRKYSLSAGIAGEFTNNVVETDTTVSTPIFDIVPSVHIQKKVSEKYTWELSMTARSKPPRYNQLNPISLSWSSYNKSSGNPNLKPEFFYQVEWDNSWKWEKSNFNFALFYKNESDIIGKWYFLETEDDKQISHSKYENLGEIISYGTDISGMLLIGKLVFRPGLVAYYTIIEGDKFASTLDTEEISYLAKVNASHPLTKNISLQVSGTYNSPFISVYGKQFEYYSVNAGIKARMFKKKVSLVIKAVDIFETVEYDKIVNQRINYLKETHYNPNNFSLYVSLSYKFNSVKKKKKKSKKR
jgi:outer membrane cobalamin receptor